MPVTSSNLKPVFELRGSQSMPGPSLVLTAPSLCKNRRVQRGPPYITSISQKRSLMDNKNGIIRQSEGCRFIPKMHPLPKPHLLSAFGASTGFDLPAKIY